jgi:hypothetical protein
MPRTTSSTTISPSQPKGWTSTHDACIRRHIRNGEDALSILILFETEFPAVRVNEAWVRQRLRDFSSNGK